MNNNPQFHVVIDIDGTTPPIAVVPDTDSLYCDILNKRQKKTADFRKDYRHKDEQAQKITKVVKDKIRTCCPCDKESQIKFLNKRFPVWRVMKQYKWKADLPSDIVSGLTVGIMQLPQGMAYALLAELPPVIGLYMAFFPVLIYVMFGTSRHVSMGTVALISLLTGSVISRFYDPSLASTLGLNVTRSDNNGTLTTKQIEIELPDSLKISIATSLCLLVGLVQLGMGVFHMGFVTTYMSDALIGGFTTGAAVHVATSQVKYVFGLSIPRSDGIFQIIKNGLQLSKQGKESSSVLEQYEVVKLFVTYKLILSHITETNLATLIMSLICMFVLYLVKTQINDRFKTRMKFPIPVELLVVVASTLFSHFLNFSKRYHMKIVGPIPAGLPTPSIPSFHSTSVYTADVFIIAVVAFSQGVGLVALLAKRHGYSYDANQELIAYGAGNIFGSFFSCFPYAASVSRSSVQESAGGKTQLASMVTAVFVMIVTVSIGPLFQPLPNCVLAAIILVALKSMFEQFMELPKILRTSVYDFLIWVVTFSSVVILHVDYGIMIGILFSFLSVVIRTQRTPVENLQKIDTVHRYEDSSKYKQTQPVIGVKVIGFKSPIYFANGALFTKQVYTMSGVIPAKQKKKMDKLQMSHEESQNFTPLVNESNEMMSLHSFDENNDLILHGEHETDYLIETCDVHHIILDMSGVSFIDTVGAKVLKQLTEEYEDVKIQLLLSCVNDEVWRVLDAMQFLRLFKDRIFLTIDDAVNAAVIYSMSTNDGQLKFPQEMMYRENNNADEAAEDALLSVDSDC